MPVPSHLTSYRQTEESRWFYFYRDYVHRMKTPTDPELDHHLGTKDELHLPEFLQKLDEYLKKTYQFELVPSTETPGTNQILVTTQVVDEDTFLINPEEFAEVMPYFVHVRKEILE